VERKSEAAALVYSHSLTPRLRYMVDYLSRYFGLPFVLTPDEAAYRNSPVACKINYSFQPILNGEIRIHPHALLFESTIHPVKVECFSLRGRPAFFRAEGSTGFDLLAALFYLVSRYEEYLPHSKDLYGRYAHTGSLAFREGFLSQPLADLWLEDFRTLLRERNPGFGKKAHSFRWLPTYDIDMAWSFRHKGYLRNGGALLRLLLSGRWGQLVNRIGVLRGLRTDPFDAYTWMDRLHEEGGLKPIYFFLVAAKRGQYDKNIAPSNTAFIALLKTLAGRYAIGLHPSWASGDEPTLLRAEKRGLEAVISHSITASRQHYIRLTLPATYRQLLATGITSDYSMGYGSINGFRASTAHSFYWYDLAADEATPLLVHPFCFMDANAYYEQGLSDAEALQELQYYRACVEEVGGTCITIWHNSFLGTAPAFSGWKEVYAEFARSI
jgi:hypothetical protein